MGDSGLVCAMGCGVAVAAGDVGGLYVARLVCGWEVPRAQGGTNHVMLRSVGEGVAHVQCVRNVSAGISPSQGGLF